MKKAFLATFACSMVLGSTPVFAQDIDSNSNLLSTEASQDVPVSREYFEFYDQGVNRMDSTGDFGFNIFSVVDSDRFTLKSTSCTVTIGAQLYNAPSVSNPKGKVTLYKYGVIDTKVESFTFSVDTKLHSHTFRNLKVGQKYYLKIEYLDGVGYIDGGGKVTNIDEVF